MMLPAPVQDFLGGNQFGTAQTDVALMNNNNLTRGGTRDQIAYEEAMRRNRAGFDAQQMQQQQQFAANMGNNAANANSARSMALGAQQALNSMYTDAGNRLNAAAANTQGALNQAAGIAAGMFR